MTVMTKQLVTMRVGGRDSEHDGAADEWAGL